MDDTLQIRSPPLTSLFPCNTHPNLQECVAYADASYVRDLEPVARKEKSTPHSRLAKLGSCTAVLYPQGDSDRLPATIDGYMAFLFLDDLIDDSTDLGYVAGITSQFLSVTAGKPTNDQRFLLFSRFFSDARWDRRILALAQDEAERFMKGALALRAIEAQERKITVDEYLDIRVPNTAMGFMFRVIGFAQPELADGLDKLVSGEPDL